MFWSLLEVFWYWLNEKPSNSFIIAFIVSLAGLYLMVSGNNPESTFPFIYDLLRQFGKGLLYVAAGFLAFGIINLIFDKYSK